MGQTYKEGQIVLLGNGMGEKACIKKFLGSGERKEWYEAEYRTAPKLLQWSSDTGFLSLNPGESREDSKKTWNKFCMILNSKFKDTGITLDVPEKVNLTDNGVFFLMGEVPQDYYSFKDYAEEKKISQNGKEFTVRFASIPAVIEAAWKLVKFYKTLYEESAFYLGDLKDAVYFHAKTGNMIFRDVYGLRKFGVKVRHEDLYNEYPAPELILEQTDVFTEDTENWSLAVYLYELFYHSGGPFKGMKSMCQNFYSMEEEYRWMAEEGVFTMEENLCENRPVHGVQDRLIKYWETYPQEIRQSFTEVFVDGKTDMEARKTPKEWQMVLNQMKTDYLICSCGKKGFVSEFKQTKEGHYCCPVCGKQYYTFESGKNRIYLCNGTKLMQWQLKPTDTESSVCMGMVVENRQRKGVFGVKNMSCTDWTGVDPSGAERTISPGGGIPIWQGLCITFDENCVWKIKGKDEVNDGGRYDDGYDESGQQ